MKHDIFIYFPFCSTFRKTSCRCHVLLTRICAESWQGQKPLRRIWRNGTGLGRSWPGPCCNYNEPTIPLWFYPHFKNCIREICPCAPIWKFAPRRGRLRTKLFWSLLKGRVWLASVQNFNLHSPAFMFFAHKYHILDKYLTKMFPLGSLGSFSHDPNRFIRLRSKWSKIQAFTFCNFRTP